MTITAVTTRYMRRGGPAAVEMVPNDPRRFLRRRPGVAATPAGSAYPETAQPSVSRDSIYSDVRYRWETVRGSRK